MAFIQWRRFHFFDLTQKPDDGKLDEPLKDANLVAYTSGRGRLIFGDEHGLLHFVNRQFEVQSFRAFEKGQVYLIHQMKQSGYFIALGENDSANNPCLKVLNVDNPDQHGNPTVERTASIGVAGKVSRPLCLAVHENLNLMAIGYDTGTVILHLGDITKDRGSRQKVILQGSNAISGLCFRSEKKNTKLYVATTAEVLCYTISNKNIVSQIHLDHVGCSQGLTIPVNSLQDAHFMMGRCDAVYCYTDEGRSQCYAFEGDKKALLWFRNYMVLVHSDNKTPTNKEEERNDLQDKNILNILDLQNKFLAYTAPIKSVKALLSEWGFLFILTEDNRLIQLTEKDIKSKLDILFKKSFYDLAVKIAKMQQYDQDALVDIFKQYGDHLYVRADYSGAIENYIKTIGHLEPSYIIRRFMDAHKIHFLTQYLQALHSQGEANEVHTTLLLNCYTKLKDRHKLDEFILKDREQVDFDVDIAIQVCRQSGYSEHALNLAKRHGKHDWYMKMQIEDAKGYSQALAYIQKLDFEDAEANMKIYGSALMRQLPEETTDFLKQLCTDYKPINGTLISEEMIDGQDNDDLPRQHSAEPGKFLHLFVKNSDMMVNFLEYMIEVKPSTSGSVYTTLMEHYLYLYSESQDLSFRVKQEEKVMGILKNESANYDEDQALILCQRHQFRKGTLFLYEKKLLFDQILHYYADASDFSGVLQTCRKFGAEDPNLWVTALQLITREGDAQLSQVSEILDMIEEHHLLSPVLIINTLSMSSTACLNLLRSYLFRVLDAEDRQSSEHSSFINMYMNTTHEIRNKIDGIKKNSSIFQGTKCSICEDLLEIPSIHFLCQHSYHQHCFKSYSDSEKECVKCSPENRRIQEIIKSQKKSTENHDEFQHNLEKAENSFDVIADYFGRGIFHQRHQITELADQVKKLQGEEESVPPQPDATQRLDVGPGAEARIRVEEKRKSPINIKQPSEGRLRTETPHGSLGSLKRSTAAPSNPFDNSAEKDEDRNNPFLESSEAELHKNPFTQSKEVSTNNPFGDPDDYDESLNPFGES